MQFFIQSETVTWSSMPFLSITMHFFILFSSMLLCYHQNLLSHFNHITWTWFLHLQLKTFPIVHLHAEISAWCHNSFSPSMPRLYNLTVINTETCWHKDGLFSGSVSELNSHETCGLEASCQEEWHFNFELFVQKRIQEDFTGYKTLFWVELMIKATK